MPFLQSISDYGYGLGQRIVNASRPDQGMISAGIAFGTYTAIRAGLITATGLNVPLIGGVTLTATFARILLGGFVGGMAGATYGNRYGQIVDALKPKDEEINNQTFMMRTLPAICGATAEVLTYLFPGTGGNPILIQFISATELHIFTIVNGVFVGGTIAHRGGKFIDYLTDGKLVADLGLFSAYKYVKGKITSHNTADTSTQTVTIPNQLR